MKKKRLERLRNLSKRKKWGLGFVGATMVITLVVQQFLPPAQAEKVTNIIHGLIALILQLGV